MSVSRLSGGESISNWSGVFLPSSCSLLMALMGTGFPNALDSADWQFHVDFLNGSVEIAGGVLFFFCLLGDGAISSDEADD